MTLVSSMVLEYEAGLAHHRLASKYLGAARIVYEATIPNVEHDWRAMLSEYEPLVFLCSHSMELNFKAYLTGHGMQIRDAEALKHDLGKLARECYAEGTALPEWTKISIDVANAVYSRSKSATKQDFRARYPRKPEDGPTELLFPNVTIRTAEVVANLAGAAARQRAEIVRSRLGA